MIQAISALAWAQYGAFSAQQAADAGVSSSWIARQLANGLIERRAPAVYAFVSAPRTARQELMVHLLGAGAGAFATADSGLDVWCPELLAPAKPIIAVPRTCGYRSDRVEIRRSSDLHLANPAVVDGVPVVGVARALLDSAVDRSVDEVLARIDACRRHRPVSVGALVDVLDRHQRRGRPGITTFRTALAAMRSEVTDSEFERLVLRDLAQAGVPTPRVHHVVRLGPDVFELDLAWPELLLDVELDGSDHTVRVRKARRDRHRDRCLQAAGWLVPRYTWDDYVASRSAMIGEIGELVEARTQGRPRFSG